MLKKKKGWDFFVSTKKKVWLFSQPSCVSSLGMEILNNFLNFPFEILRLSPSRSLISFPKCSPSKHFFNPVIRLALHNERWQRKIGQAHASESETKEALAIVVFKANHLQPQIKRTPGISSDHEWQLNLDPSFSKWIFHDEFEIVGERKSSDNSLRWKLCQAYLEISCAVVKTDEKLFRLSRKLWKLFKSSSNCVLIFRLLAYIQKLISRNHLNMNSRELMIIIPTDNTYAQWLLHRIISFSLHRALF